MDRRGAGPDHDDVGPAVPVEVGHGEGGDRAAAAGERRTRGGEDAGRGAEVDGGAGRRADQQIEDAVAAHVGHLQGGHGLGGGRGGGAEAGLGRDLQREVAVEDQPAGGEVHAHYVEADVGADRQDVQRVAVDVDRLRGGVHG